MNKKILIVRNEKEEANALSFLLSGTGYRTSSHSTAESALEAARLEQYDLAITDRSLAENRRDMGFVSKLKEAQPKLPVFLLSENHELDDVIKCIRAGVTAIIDEPENLKRVFEATNAFFEHDGDSNDDVSWEDMVEVEQTLTALFKKNNDPSNSVEATSKRLNDELANALKKISDLEDSSETLKRAKDKAESLVAEIKNSSDGSEVGSADYVERQSQLKEREDRLKEREAKIGKQKAEAEIMLGDLEARQFEIEENGHPPSETEAAEIQKALDSAQMQWNGTRLDLEAQITDLNRDVEQAKASSNVSEEIKEELRNLQELHQQASEEVAEKEFILEQRSKEIEKLKEQLEVGQVAIQTIEDLEEEKRMLEVERFKLQEKTDKFEEANRTFDEKFESRQREIDVNKRDAEISLRELQNRVKEEQLTLKVDLASFKDESRQFEQARQNFQEDIEDLQSKQSELKNFEEQLKKMESNLGDAKALPRHTPQSTAKSEVESRESAPADTPKAEVPQSEPSIARQDDTPPPGPSDDAFKPDTWKGPPKKSRKGNRGPLRIGGRPSSG